jgi:uncharacterized protein
MQDKVLITSKSGLNLSAVVEIPDSDKKFPFMVLLHGFKGYKEEETYTDLATKLRKVGIASIRFDASGFGESEGTLEDDYRFSSYVTDTEGVYEWLIRQEFCDARRVGVCGQSMGGAQTIVLAGKHPEIKAACAISPPDKIGTRDALGQVADNWKKLGYLDDTSSKYGKIRVPYAYLVDAQKYDFANCVRDIHCPLLILLGSHDDIVLPEQTRAVYEAANEPKQLLKLDDMTHFYKRTPDVLNAVNEKVVLFFVKNLTHVK